MPGGTDSEFNALYAIACSTAEMAVAAGGIGQNSGFVTEDDLVNIIACNLSQTVGGLGTPCNYGWTDTDGAWLAILFYSGQLTGITGTELNAGSTASLEGILYGIACDLDQVATNTGQAAGGVGAGTYLDQLNAIACISAQIVTNGFVPPTPVQVFINALKAFGSAVILVADQGAGSVNNTPVPVWADQGGHGADGTPVAGATTPKLFTAVLNGKNIVRFDGVLDQLQGAYVNSSAVMAAFVVFSNTGGGSSGRIISTAEISGGGDDTTDAPCFIRIGGGLTTSNPAQLSNVAQAPFTFHSAAAWFDGADTHIQRDAVVGTGSPYSTTMATALYTLGQSSDLTAPFGGDYGCVVLYKTNQSANVPAILALINAYYGL